LHSGFFELENNEINYQDIPEIKQDNTYGITFGAFGGFPIDGRKTNSKILIDHTLIKKSTENFIDRFGKQFNNDFEENMLLNSYNWPKDTPKQTK
jgi:hypothetical protein